MSLEGVRALEVDVPLFPRVVRIDVPVIIEEEE